MKNDRLILSLIKQGRLTANPETGQVYLDGKPKGWRKDNGYVVFAKFHNGKKRIIRCHRVVWMFVKNKMLPYGMEVNHVDGDKANNCSWNLEATTGAENVRHAHKSGLCTYRTDKLKDPVTGQFISELPKAPF